MEIGDGDWRWRLEMAIVSKMNWLIDSTEAEDRDPGDRDIPQHIQGDDDGDGDGDGGGSGDGNGIGIGVGTGDGPNGGIEGDASTAEALDEFRGDKDIDNRGHEHTDGDGDGDGDGDEFRKDHIVVPDVRPRASSASSTASSKRMRDAEDMLARAQLRYREAEAHVAHLQVLRW